MRKQFIILFILAIAAIESNAQHIYMRVNGTKQGQIKDSYNAKFPDKIELTGYSFEYGQASNGIIAGRRSRAPLTITKNNSSSTVQLFNAFLTTEMLKNVVIEVWKTTPQGTEVLEQTITLTNATISFFREEYDNNPAPGGAKGPYDQIKFNYQKLNVLWTTGSIEAEDSGSL